MKLSLEHLEARENPAGPVLIDPVTGLPINDPPPAPPTTPPPAEPAPPAPGPTW